MVYLQPVISRNERDTALNNRMGITNSWFHVTSGPFAPHHMLRMLQTRRSSMSYNSSTKDSFSFTSSHGWETALISHLPLTCGGLHPAEKRWGTQAGRGVAAPPRPSPCTWRWSWAARGDPAPNRRPQLGWTRLPCRDPPYRWTRPTGTTRSAWTG